MKKFLALGLLALPFSAQAADCFISYYGYIGRTSDGRDAQVPREPALSTEKVTYTTSTQSAAFPAGTQFVGVVCNATAHYVVAADPTADANDPYFVTDVWAFFAVNQSGLKIAFHDGN